jgi:LysR family transcriptional regulator, low CO2-responsive transcriptional regulator
MELKELRSLVALADLGSITLVGERLHLSPAAIHKQLKVMEAELGVRLYEHVGRKLELTPASQMLMPFLRDLLAQYDSAISALDEWKGMKRGVVRIGAGPTISSYVLPVLLRRFRRACPQVELFVESGNTPVLMDGLRHGALDLALIVSADLLEGEDFHVEAHWDFELVLVSHRRHAPRQCQLAELARFPFILFRQGSRMQEPIDRHFAAHEFHPRVIMRFDNAEAIKAMIRTGLGISILPVWTVDADIRQHRLQWIRMKERPVVSRLALVSRKARYVPAAVEAFIDGSRHVDWKSPRLTYQASPART